MDLAVAVAVLIVVVAIACRWSLVVRSSPSPRRSVAASFRPGAHSDAAVMIASFVAGGLLGLREALRCNQSEWDLSARTYYLFFDGRDGYANTRMCGAALCWDREKLAPK